MTAVLSGLSVLAAIVFTVMLIMLLVETLDAHRRQR
jgi:hypothetical protein